MTMYLAVNRMQRMAAWGEFAGLAAALCARSSKWETGKHVRNGPPFDETLLLLKVGISELKQGETRGTYQAAQGRRALVRASPVIHEVAGTSRLQPCATPPSTPDGMEDADVVRVAGDAAQIERHQLRRKAMRQRGAGCGKPQIIATRSSTLAATYPKLGRTPPSSGMMNLVVKPLLLSSA